MPASTVSHDYHLTMFPHKLFLLERNRWSMLLANTRLSTRLALSPLLALTELMMWGYCLLRGPSFLRAKLRLLPLDLRAPRANSRASAVRRLAPPPLRLGRAAPAALGLSARPVRDARARARRSPSATGSPLRAAFQPTPYPPRPLGPLHRNLPLCRDNPARLPAGRPGGAACAGPPSSLVPRGAGRASRSSSWSARSRSGCRATPPPPWPPPRSSSLASVGFLIVRREAILGPAVGLALPVALLAGFARLAALHRQRPPRDPGRRPQQRHGDAPGRHRLPARPARPAATEHRQRVPGRTAQPGRDGRQPARHRAAAGLARAPARRPNAHGDRVAGCAAEASRLAAHPRRRPGRARLPDRLGARDRRVQGTDRRHVPDRLRAGAAGDRARARRPHRDRDRARR